MTIHSWWKRLNGRKNGREVRMKKTALHKDIYRTITGTLPRFLSIFFIVVLGVAFYAGIRVTQKDMHITADHQFDDLKLMDVKVMGTLGISKENLESMKKLSKTADIEGGHSTDVISKKQGSDDEHAVKVVAETKKLNQITIVQGKLPKKSGECLVDEWYATQNGLKIGDILELSSGTEDDLKDTLNDTTYKITAIGRSAEYLSRSRGSTTIETGTLSGFIIVKQSEFSSDIYTEVYLTAKGAKSERAYSDAYKDKVKELEDQLKDISKDENKKRLSSVWKEAFDKISKKEKTFKKERKKVLNKLDKADKELKDSRQKINDSKSELEQSKKKLASAKSQIQTAKAQYQSGIKQISSARKQLKTQKQTIKTKSSQLDTQEAKIKEQEQQLEKREQQINQALQAGAITEQEAQASMIQINAGKQQIETAKAQIPSGKQQLKAAQTKLVNAERTLNQKSSQLKTAKQTIESNEAKLVTAQKQIDSGATKIKEAERKLDDGEKKLKKSRKKAEKKLKDAENKIKDAKEDVKNIKQGKWYILNREKMQSYVEYGQEADRIAALGQVVPVIFFLVAALVSLTAMTRMVEEQRTQIGMMKALGYSGFHIAMKYVSYALAATLTGSILGAVIGEKLLPWIIINAYKMMYTGLGDVYTPLETEYSVMATGLAVGVVVFAVLSACYKELKEKPAQLMRPVAPKEGKRILLERIPFVWKRLSFIWKATMRNLFRYKKRFFMTIFGIGGCMALLLLGFGIKDSISAISKNQYGEIITYDFSITYKDGIKKAKKEEFVNWTKKQDHMTDLMEVSESAVTIRANGEKQDATMILPMSKDDFNGYITLQDRKSKTKYKLDDEGIILTEKAASLLGVSKGDTITIKKSGDRSIKAKISQITENYLQHKVYMTPKLYARLYHKKAEPTGIYCIEKNISKKKMQENGKKILTKDEASALHFSSDDAKTMEDMVNNLNIVVVVLIVSAGLLAFVVLYNLNNINISERRMELATIKVLGFYDGEVGAYVYRENILLTILGTIAGIILGILLHKYVIFTTEVDLIMFGRQIYLPSYVYSILLTIAFSILVNFFMYFQLKKIDMVESLKSTE